MEFFPNFPKKHVRQNVRGDLYFFLFLDFDICIPFYILLLIEEDMENFVDAYYNGQQNGFSDTPIFWNEENSKENIDSCHQIKRLIETIEVAIGKGSWSEFEGILPELFGCLMDIGGGDVGSLFRVNHEFRENRNVFVHLGGLELLKSLFKPPFLPKPNMRFSDSCSFSIVLTHFFKI